MSTTQPKPKSPRKPAAQRKRPAGAARTRSRKAVEVDDEGVVRGSSSRKSGKASKARAKTQASRAGAGQGARASTGRASTTTGRARTGRARAGRPVFTAKTADKHELYQLAVQSPEEDVAFLARVYRSIRKKRALHFREDFCGTGLLSSWWIRQSPQHTAEGFDIDPEPVAWGMAHHFDDLGEDALRYTVHLKDVREPSHRPPDIRAAQNFSYCIFHERAEMLAYLRAARDDLADDGVFVMDLHGGPEATEEMEEVRDCGGFDYVLGPGPVLAGDGRVRLLHPTSASRTRRS